MSTYTDRFERETEGLDALSTGICPGCPECASAFGMEQEEFDAAYEAGSITDEPHFSWQGCDLCGSELGGDVEPWHAIVNGELTHGDNACVDCILYIANGDEPQED